MADIVDSATRSRMMAGIRSRNTRPELVIRSLLHRKGFRFRLHVRDLPGKPDIVFPRYRAVIFIHGCFWHGHAGCRLFRLPGTRTEFWQEKICRNQANDQKAEQALLAEGWRVCIVWECKIRASKKDYARLADMLSSWLLGEETFLVLEEKPDAVTACSQQL